MAAFQVELAAEFSLRERLAVLEEQAAGLQVTASANGKFLTANPSLILDQWIQPGTELAAIGETNGQIVRVLIPQQDIDAVRQQQGQELVVHFWGSNSDDCIGRLAHIDPRATTTLNHPALSATADGPVAVRPTTSAETSNNKARAPMALADPSQWSLVEPHFEASVVMTSSDLRQAGTGQRGIVELTTTHSTVGRQLTLAAHRWLDARNLTQRR